MFKLIVDNRNRGSIASKLRQRRTAFFKSLLEFLEPPVRILDVGGTDQYWKMIGGLGKKEVSITLLNLESSVTSLPNFISISGDARHLEFENKSFDVVFSNSVIEHVGDYKDQKSMANEVRRVGKRYFVQTPNRYFPLEPHFVFPFFQFLPLRFRMYLLMNFNLGWFPKTPDEVKSRQIVESIQLLGKSEVKALFPEASIYEERFLGLTKSFVAYGGWNI